MEENPRVQLAKGRNRMKKTHFMSISLAYGLCHFSRMEKMLGEHPVNFPSHRSLLPPCLHLKKWHRRRNLL
jgi:hypothetical protein